MSPTAVAHEWRRQHVLREVWATEWQIPLVGGHSRVGPLVLSASVIPKGPGRASLIPPTVMEEMEECVMNTIRWRCCRPLCPP